MGLFRKPYYKGLEDRYSVEEKISILESVNALNILLAAAENNQEGVEINFLFARSYPRIRGSYWPELPMDAYKEDERYAVPPESLAVTLAGAPRSPRTVEKLMEYIPVLADSGDPRWEFLQQWQASILEQSLAKKDTLLPALMEMGDIQDDQDAVDRVIERLESGDKNFLFDAFLSGFSVNGIWGGDLWGDIVANYWIPVRSGRFEDAHNLGFYNTIGFSDTDILHATLSGDIPRAKALVDDAQEGVREAIVETLKMALDIPHYYDEQASEISQIMSYVLEK